MIRRGSLHQQIFRLARAVVVLSASVVVIGSFLPWIVSGQSTRNSFSTVRTARALELVDNSALNALICVWFLVPVAAALVALLVILKRRRSVAFLSAGLGIVATLFSGFVMLSPIETSVGPPVTSFAGLALLIGAVGMIAGRASP